MTETQLFVSSCSKREMAKRRHSRHVAALLRIGYSAATVMAIVAICGGAFIAGRGGI